MRACGRKALHPKLARARNLGDTDDVSGDGGHPAVVHLLCTMNM